MCAHGKFHFEGRTPSTKSLGAGYGPGLCVPNDCFASGDHFCVMYDLLATASKLSSGCCGLLGTSLASRSIVVAVEHTCMVTLTRSTEHMHFRLRLVS